MWNVSFINEFCYSNIFGHLKSYKDLLGTVQKNESGHIIAAKAIYNYWYLTKNFSAIDTDKTGNYAGTGDWVSLSSFTSISSRTGKQ